MNELQNVHVVAEGLAFPEGPVALRDGSVVVVEMMGGRISRVGPDGTITLVAEVGGGPNGAAIGPDGALYVCNNGGRDPATRLSGRIQRVDLATARVETVYTSCADQPLVAPNDLVFDASGNFYFTDFTHNGAIYYASPDGMSIRAVATRAPSPNGIGLSPDGNILYWAETHVRQVQRRQISAPGELVATPGYNIRALLYHGSVEKDALLVGLPNNHELDSLAVDSSGAVCVGTLVDSGICEINPDGTWILHTLPPSLADGAVTNICFGGADMRTAFLTCSMTGRLIRCDWHRPGLKLAFEG